MNASAELYRASFLRRSAAAASSGHTLVDQVGICGVLGPAGRPDGRLLITDDRALPVLQALAAPLSVRFVTVFDDAPECGRHVRTLDRWRVDAVTAMACGDLTLVPTPPAVPELTVRPVRRSTSDPADWVPLEQAVAACMEADPMAAGFGLDAGVATFRSLPGARLFAALDATDAVRATAGASVSGPDASVFFVSTQERWRNRGVATAMTGTALGWAGEAGARGASLDASPAGRSIYRRLGFDTVASATVFNHPG